MSIIPTFILNSKQLIDFKSQHLTDDHYSFKYLEHYWYNSQHVTVLSSRKVWIRSGIQYIVDHGKFKTLETSIAQQQNTISEVL